MDFIAIASTLPLVAPPFCFFYEMQIKIEGGLQKLFKLSSSSWGGFLFALQSQLKGRLFVFLCLKNVKYHLETEKSGPDHTTA